jgi:hypothetical protein
LDDGCGKRRQLLVVSFGKLLLNELCLVARLRKADGDDQFVGCVIVVLKCLLRLRRCDVEATVVAMDEVGWMTMRRQKTIVDDDQAT